MKKTLLLALFVCGMLHLKSQNLQSYPIENVIYDGVIIDEVFISSISEMELTRESAYRTLPNSVDNSTPYNDSIFATINLGNLYLKMNSNGIKNNRGKLRQFIPKSAKEHAKNTDIALRKLKMGNNNNQFHSLPEVIWTDIVTSQPEGYVVDDNGNIHIHSAEALAWLSAVSNGMYGNEATNFEDVTIILENDIDLSGAKWFSIAGINNDGIVENTYYYFDENDYWQLKESIVYNENTTDNLIEALNLGVEHLNNEGYSCLNWSDTGMDFDNMGLPVFDDFENILSITEKTSDNISIYPNPAKDVVKVSAVSLQWLESSIVSGCWSKKLK